MEKNNIIKGIVIILSISIIICTFLIIVKILNKMRDGGEDFKEINIQVSGKAAEIKSFQINGGKIYLLVKSIEGESIVIINEKKEKEVQRIKILTKENCDE